MNLKKAGIILMACVLLVGCRGKGNDLPVGNSNNKDLNPKADTSPSEKSVNKSELSENANNFAKSNFAEVMDYMMKSNNSKSFVYSPLSHLSCANLLNKYTDMSEDNYLQQYNGLDFSKLNLNNTESESMLIVKKLKKSDKDFGEVRFAEFPKQAESLSKDLQNRILKETFLEPDYSDPDIHSVGLNVVRFFGRWKQPFDVASTENVEHTLLDGSKVLVDKMYSANLASDSNIGYEDDDVQIYKKPLVEEKGDKESSYFVYIIAPKRLDKVKSVGYELFNYIDKYEKHGKGYDEVYLNLPKIDIKNQIDLKKALNSSEFNYLQDTYHLNNLFNGEYKDDIKIDKLIQVASLQVDENKVEAKAVTEMKLETMSAPPTKVKDIFEMDVDKPFYVVVASGVKGSSPLKNSTISFVSYVNNPIEK